ncbi:MAG: hypothetical protein ACI9NI_001177 [Olleya marilimosa]|jgi:hypothetical protein
MKQFIVLAYLLFIVSCNNTNTPTKTIKQNNEVTISNNKIKVLNFGSFHFGETTDANSTEFDETSPEAQKQIKQIAQMLAAFKPTIICVENLPSLNDTLNKDYQKYLKNPDQLDTNYGETSMIGFEVGRLNAVSKLYGIDNHMGYNYSVGDFFESSPDYTNAIDPKTYLQLTNQPFKDYPEMAKRDQNYEKLSLLEKLKLINEPIQLDQSIVANADKLLYVGTEDNFEGADNAAKFYHRNMKIYSNLNRIPMTKQDRVFIIMGSAHTAFLREFINRSPKFEMVNTLEYLK